MTCDNDTITLKDAASLGQPSPSAGRLCGSGTPSARVGLGANNATYHARISDIG